MAMGTRETDQPPLWIATSLPTSPGHPFYGHAARRAPLRSVRRKVLRARGRPSLHPGALPPAAGRLLRRRRLGTRDCVARDTRWRSAAFCGWPWTRRRPRSFDCATRRLSIWRRTGPSLRGCNNDCRGRPSEGKTIAIDATTLEANAAMRSIVRRDTGESYGVSGGSRDCRRDWIGSGRRRPRTQTGHTPTIPMQGARR